MDGIDDYIWQRRIHHGVRYQKGAVPFPQSVEIGLEFNAALERKEKLDESLLTNGVMVDICDFAKTVTKSEKYFLFEMLEFNFDLGVDMDNDKQCYEYATRIHGKIKLLKEQIKFKTQRFRETFLLPDQNAIMRLSQSKKGRDYCPKRNKIVDASVLTDGSKNGQSSENQMTASNGAVSSSCVIKRRGRAKLTGDAYPFCKELGVTLIFQSDDPLRQKLDRSLVTNIVMMELLDFSRVLCGTHTGIVCDLVKQNFGLELDKTVLRMCVSKLTERRYTCITAEARDAFRKEPFKVTTKKPEQNCRKRKKPDTNSKEVERLTKASERWGTLTNGDDDGDLSYMCPVDFETEMQSGTEAKPEKMMIVSPAKSAVSMDVKQEEEEAFVSPVQPLTNGHNSSSFNPRPKTTTTLRAVSDLMSEDTNEDINVKDLKQKLWRRRAPRSKQILKSSKVNDLFTHCRKIALDFNVGSGNKQNVDLKLLTNHVLWEIYRFANLLKKSAQSFLLEILDVGFNFVLQDETQQRNFIYYMITKEKILQSSPDRWKMEFLNSPVRFPEVYNTVDMTSESQTVAEQEPGVESPASATNQQTDMEPHQFCNKLGLNLWSTKQRQASQKLDLNTLTTGATLEIFSFVRELCGEVREVVNDILEHNFDVDLQSGATEAAKVIQRWYTTQRYLIKNHYRTPKANRWLNAVVPLKGHVKLGPKPPTHNHPEDLDTEDVKPIREALDAKMQQVKKVNSYCICKEIGLDLEISRKSEPKKKLDLRLLTRGALLEIHQYVEQNSKRYVPSLYEILEYNFDLSPLKHGKVEFAWSIASKAVVIADKISRKGDYLNKVFELPFEVSQSPQIKEEPEDDFSEPDLHDNSDVVFVRELKAVDIEVEIE
ncbi:uncharacterized protein [Pagrus major]|uniref:uncharacterized protein n=1 Tax=Pagrus major TaxID=143350 RepID=UPI003CC89B7C